MNRTVVVGLGTPSRGDAGIGLAILECLCDSYEIPDGVLLLDGASRHLLKAVAGARRLLLLDAIEGDEPPGTAVRLEGVDVHQYLDLKFAPHQVQVRAALAAADPRGRAAQRRGAPGRGPRGRHGRRTARGVGLPLPPEARARGAPRVRAIEARDRAALMNDVVADRVRRRLTAAQIPALNLCSSPGSGKTMLLERTVRDLGEELGIAVITGDVQTRADAERISRHTDRLVQAVVADEACHLEARQIDQALDAIDLESTHLLLIENVGNLVCPAHWDLGELAKVVVFSVTEGEDKPLKYPKMFQQAKVAVINKIDLLPHLEFDLTLALRYAKGINHELKFFQLSAQTGEGMDAWFAYLRSLTTAVVPA